MCRGRFRAALAHFSFSCLGALREFSLCLRLSLSVSDCLCVSVSVSMSLFVSVSPSLSLSLSLSVSVSVCLSRSLACSFALCLHDKKSSVSSPRVGSTGGTALAEVVHRLIVPATQSVVPGFAGDSCGNVRPEHVHVSLWDPTCQ